MEKKRDGFKSRTGFVIACIGSAVGMGNIWRFPYMVSDWEGLTFLIPYVLFVILIGASGVIEEMALGRAAKGGPIIAFGKCTEVRTGNKKIGEGIGLIPVVGSLALAIGYTVVVGWIFKYTFLALSGQLAGMGKDMNDIGGMFADTATKFGNNLWLIIAVIVTVVIMAFGIASGIERANKIMMPLLFVLFLGLGIYIFTLPGATNGYKYIFTINPKGLLNPRLWIYAFGQAFFSLSIAGNGTVIYGSYLSKSENVVTSARNVAIFDTLAALLAAFVIIPGMAVGGAELSSGGPGLMFIYLVNVFNGMPGGKIVGIIFYICVLFAGMSSLVNLYEAPVATLQEKLGLKRPMAVGCIGLIGCIVALVIQGIVSGWMDAVSIYICPLGAMLAAIMFFWVAGKDFAISAVNEGKNKPIGRWFIPLGRYVLVPLAFIALVAGAILGGIG
ncbi:sodium-dependent transporter [uncultured Eubacterium sp.]|uniref:sodium-dependent transporter n=1 Tax=Eubacterium sp. TaxID=142586 RepID=UPI0026715C46|nr:sodium-dependent transporter [uncultured Eubacterium sp.]